MEQNMLSHQIKELRKERSWSQALLAEASGLSLRTVQRIEANGKGAPETLLAIAGAFDVDVENFTKQRLAINEELSEQFFGIHISNQSLLIRFKSWFGMRLALGQKLMAGLGGLMISLPVVFVATNVIRYVLGFELFPNVFELFKSNEQVHTLFNNLSPFLFFSGLLIGPLFNILPFLDVEIKLGKQNGIRLFYSGSLLNTLVWVTGLLSFTILLSYALIENGIIIFGL